MENNKYCRKCGTKIEEGSIYCYNCGSSLTQNTQQNTIQNNSINVNVQNQDNDKEGDILGIISLILYFAGSGLVSALIYNLPPDTRNYFSSLAGLCPLASIVVMIVGRIKYPKNKLLKIAMWTIIICTLVGIIAFIVIIVILYLTCSSIAYKAGC